MLNQVLKAMLPRENKIVLLVILILIVTCCNRQIKYNEREVADIRERTLAASISILGEKNYYSDKYEVVVNYETEKATTDKKLKLVYENQKMKLELRKNNGDTINVANIRWLVDKTTMDSTLTKEITIADKDENVKIYEKIKDDKGKSKDAIIAEFVLFLFYSQKNYCSTINFY